MTHASLLDCLPQPTAFWRLLDSAPHERYAFEWANRAFTHMTGCSTQDLVDSTPECIPRISCSAPDVYFSHNTRRWYRRAYYHPEPGLVQLVFCEMSALEQCIASTLPGNQETHTPSDELSLLTNALSQATEADCVLVRAYSHEKASVEVVAVAPEAYSDLLGVVSNVTPQWLEYARHSRFQPVPEHLAHLPNLDCHGQVYITGLTYTVEEPTAEIVLVLRHGSRLRELHTLSFLARQMETLLVRKDVEQRLQGIEERLWVLGQNLCDAVVEADCDARYLHVFECYTKMLGRGKLVGSSIFSYIHPDDLPEVKQAFMSALSSNQKQVVEHRYLHPERGYIWLESAYILHKKPDLTLRVLLLAREISEQKKAQQELRNAHQRLLSVLDSIDAIVYVSDISSHDVLFLNKYGRAIWGDSGGKKCWQMIKSNRQSACDCCTNQQLVDRSGSPAGVYRWVTQHIDNRWYECRASAIRWVDSRMVRVVVAFDVTQHRIAERQLMASEEKYRSLIRQSLDMMCLHDLDGRILDVNPTARAQSGYTEEELLQMNVFDLHPEPLHREQIIARWKSWQVGYPVTIETVHRKKDGSIIPVEVRTGKVLLGDKQCILALARDITARRQTEEELQRSQSELVHQKNLLESILDHAPIGIWLTDLQRKPVLMNRRFREDTGFGTDHQSITQEEIAVCQVTDRDALSKEAPQRYEEKVTFQDGQQHILQTIKTKIYADDGSVLGVLGLGLDITEQKQTEEALQNQLRFERLVSDISSHFVSLRSEQLDKGIDRALKLTAEFFDVDRSYVFQFSSDGHTMTCTNEWCAEGIEPQIQHFRSFPTANLPWFIHHIHILDHVHIPDVHLLPEQAEAERHEFGRQQIRSLLCIPMMQHGTLLGFLGFDSVKQARMWKEKQILLLKVVAEIIAGAVSRHLAYSEIRRLSYHDGLTGLYNRTFLEEEMRRLYTPRQVPFSVIMADVNGLKLVNDTYGHSTGDQLLKSAAEVLRSSCRSEDIVARWGGDEFVILLPSTTQHETEGILERIRLNCKHLKVRHMPVSMALGSATQGSTKDGTSALLREAEDSMYKHKLTESRNRNSSVLYAMLKALEQESHETKEHAQRMQEMAVRIGEKLDLSESELRRLVLLITLHDIGKINIPENILTKQTALTQQEWEVVKEHPETGYRIARATEDFAHVAEDILCHHEHWDGSGYPRGIAGREIPLLARITAVVDAYDAILNGRPYRKALSPTDTLAEIKKLSGTQFDPELVTILCQIAEG